MSMNSHEQRSARRATARRLAGAFAWVAATATSAVADAPASQYAISAGTVLDTRTGLVWQRSVDSTLRTWDAAQSYCAALSLSGPGWRLPSAKELLTLVDLTAIYPAVPIDSTAFPNTPAYGFWSSSLRAGDPSSAWMLLGDSGSMTTDWLGTPANVRCVR
jgi:hypothetical protein